MSMPPYRRLNSGAAVTNLSSGILAGGAMLNQKALLRIATAMKKSGAALNFAPKKGDYLVDKRSTVGSVADKESLSCPPPI
jgi:thymidine phosphorylase